MSLNFRKSVCDWGQHHHLILSRTPNIYHHHHWTDQAHTGLILVHPSGRLGSKIEAKPMLIHGCNCNLHAILVLLFGWSSLINHIDVMFVSSVLIWSWLPILNWTNTKILNKKDFFWRPVFIPTLYIGKYNENFS